MVLYPQMESGKLVRVSPTVVHFYEILFCCDALLTVAPEPPYTPSKEYDKSVHNSFTVYAHPVHTAIWNLQ
jgi:hypothetical protein